MTAHQVCIPFEHIAPEKPGTPIIGNIQRVSGEAAEGVQIETSGNRIVEPSGNRSIETAGNRFNFLKRRPETMLMVCLSVLAATAGMMFAIEYGTGLLTMIAAYFSGGLLVTGMAGILRRISNRAKPPAPHTQDRREQQLPGN